MPYMRYTLGTIGSQRPRHGRARGGFTLVELLVAMAIFVTVIALVMVMFNAATSSSVCFKTTLWECSIFPYHSIIDEAGVIG